MTAPTIDPPPPTPRSHSARAAVDPSGRVLRADRSTRSARSTRRRRLLVVATVVGLVATALRLYAIERSYNLFIDEVTYATIARNLSSGHGLTLHGDAFLLHPPIAFLGFAGVMELFGIGGSTWQIVMHLRMANAVVGGLACALTFLLVDRAASRRAALLAAAIIAIDPFLVRFDSLVMLEAPAQLATVAVVGFLALRIGRDRTEPGGWTRARRTLVGAGVALAIAMSTKATFGMVAGLMLVVLWVTGWVIERRDAARVLIIGVVGYLSVVLLTASTWGSVGGWFSTQWHGVGRLVGVHQETGFNAPTTQVTLGERIAANLGQYGVTYSAARRGWAGCAAADLASEAVAPWSGRRPTVVARRRP